MENISLGYAGERRSGLTSHYLLGNGYRGFNPLLKRFTSWDSYSPFGLGSTHGYSYCGGDSINLEDPSGHVGLGGGFVRRARRRIERIFARRTAANVARAGVAGGDAAAAAAPVEGGAIGGAEGGAVGGAEEGAVGGVSERHLQELYDFSDEDSVLGSDNESIGGASDQDERGLYDVDDSDSEASPRARRRRNIDEINSFTDIRGRRAGTRRAAVTDLDGYIPLEEVHIDVPPLAPLDYNTLYPDVLPPPYHSVVAPPDYAAINIPPPPPPSYESVFGPGQRVRRIRERTRL